MLLLLLLWACTCGPPGVVVPPPPEPILADPAADCSVHYQVVGALDAVELTDAVPAVLEAQLIARDQLGCAVPRDTALPWVEVVLAGTDRDGNPMAPRELRVELYLPTGRVGYARRHLGREGEASTQVEAALRPALRQAWLVASTPPVRTRPPGTPLELRVRSPKGRTVNADKLVGCIFDALAASGHAPGPAEGTVRVFYTQIPRPLDLSEADHLHQLQRRMVSLLRRGGRCAPKGLGAATVEVRRRRVELSWP